MLLILYSSLISYMVFFAICIAPVSNKVLDSKNRSVFLRTVFPKNFKFGLVLSVVCLMLSGYLKNNISLVFSVILMLGFLLNLYAVMPKINNAADQPDQKKKFKRLHFISVFIYSIQIIIAITGVILF